MATIARLAMPPVAANGLAGGAEVAAHFITVGSNNVVVDDVQALTRAASRTPNHRPGAGIRSSWQREEEGHSRGIS
jgi:hypothetical protein